jgi:glutathione peroxidase-family protein
MSIELETSPDPRDSMYELFDNGHELENKWFNNIAAALQAARSIKWRFSRWVIFDPKGNIVRRFDSGEECEYWRTMQARGQANLGPVPDFKQ